MPTPSDPNAPSPAPSRPQPYVAGIPFTEITAEDWNEIQIRSQEDLQAHQHSGRDGTAPLGRTAIRDQAIDGSKIDPASELTVKSLNADTKLSAAEVSASGHISGRSLAISHGLGADLAANDRTLLLRAPSDATHGLAYKAQHAGSAVDGPVLFGASGGALASTQGGDQLALSWNAQGNVQVRGKLSARTVETTETAAFGGSVAVKGPDLVLDHAPRRTTGSTPPLRRALVHDPSDGISINYQSDYPGGVTLWGSVAIPGGLRGSLAVSGIELSRHGSTHSKLVTDGRLHVDGPERLYLLNKSGVYVTNAWGGNGNLTISGRTTLGQDETFAGNNPSPLNVKGEIKSFGNSSGLRLEDRASSADAANEWVMYASSNAVRLWRQREARDLFTVDATGLLTVNAIDSRPRVQTFRVDGDINTFYPIVFADQGWDDGVAVLEISRSYVHRDSQARGSQMAVFRWHASNWGNGSDFIDLEHYSSLQTFIASYTTVVSRAELVIWLRGGGTTYSYRTNHAITLADSTAQKKFRGHQNSEVFDIKTAIDPTIIARGKRFATSLTLPDLNVEGVIVPSVGNSGTSGIQFPISPFGGTGDHAFIRYFRTDAADSTTLQLGNLDDAGDTISFLQMGDERLTIYGGNVGVGTKLPNHKLEVNGDLRVGGGNPLVIGNSTPGSLATGGSIAEICNDTTVDRTLRIVGNGTAGLGRRVSIYDRLDVKGSVYVGNRLFQSGPDLSIDCEDRRSKHKGEARRALVHDAGDRLTVNYAGDYRGGVTVGSSLEVNGDFALQLNDLLLAGFNNHFHGLGYFAPHRPFMGAAIDGPVLWGFEGGALGVQRGGVEGVQSHLNFNGTSQYVQLPSLDFTFANGFSAEALVYYTSFQQFSRIFDIGNGQQSDNLVLANDGTTGNLVFLSLTGNQQQGAISAPGKLALNRWMTVAVTISSQGVANLYCDGVLVATQSNFGVPVKKARTSNYLGRSNWAWDAYFKGSMASVRFWERELSEAEIRDKHRRRFIGREPGMAVCYSFSGTTGQTQLIDSGWQAKHGTIVGGADWTVLQQIALRWNSQGDISVAKDCAIGSSLVFANGSRQRSAACIRMGTISTGPLPSLGVFEHNQTITAASQGLSTITSATCGLSGLDGLCSKNTRITTEAKISANGASVTITTKTWGDSVVYGASVMWVITGNE
jgi:hypothetical protein